jgi:hypothetical protein
MLVNPGGTGRWGEAFVKPLPGGMLVGKRFVNPGLSGNLLVNPGGKLVARNPGC